MYIVLGTQLRADIDKYPAVVYLRNSRTFVLHGFLEFYEVSATTKAATSIDRQ